MAKVANLKNDLAYALAATEIRIPPPPPPPPPCPRSGISAVGVEVTNHHRHDRHP